MPLTLDVIIPCYNAAATLQRAVESVVQQPQVHTIWLIDDASPETSTRNKMAELAAQYPNIRCEYLPQNGGVARARNWGALQSQADLIAFLDADDAYEPNIFSAASMAMEQFDYIILIRFKLKPVGLPTRYAKHPQLATAWHNLQMTVGGNTLFRRHLLLACGGFPQDELFRQFGGEDGALGIALTRSSVVATLFGQQEPAVLHYCRNGMHAERLLDAMLFNTPPKGISAAEIAQAEAVTQQICQRLHNMKAQLNTPEYGIMALTPNYE